MSEYDYAIEVLESGIIRDRWTLDLRYPNKKIKDKKSYNADIRKIAQLKSAIKRLKEG